MHLVIDGHDCDPSQLSDMELVRSFLDEFPDRIAMTKIIPPAVYTYRGPSPEDWGRIGVRDHRGEPHQRAHVP